MMEIVLAAGVGVYFLTRIYLWFRNREFIKNGFVSWKRKLVFLGIDFCIISATILQLKFPAIWQMHLVEYRFIIQACGFFLFLAGTFLSSWSRLTLGRSWRPASYYQCNQQQNLVTCGPYAFLRHPIYAGMIFVGFGFELSLLSWFFLAITPLTFILYWQAKLEEKMLEASFPQYKQYRMATKMLLPGIF